WLNNDPNDSDHRHLIAARWKEWRLYKHEEADPWQLFNLVSDPAETTDLADEHRDVVDYLSERHANWASTLAPLGAIVKVTSSAEVPRGHGWATSAD
ncbi:MAG: hypothetical protein AAGG46_06135, partial [Planctomycetota bacterium]